jgi:hypothetical protein
MITSFVDELDKAHNSVGYVYSSQARVIFHFFSFKPHLTHPWDIENHIPDNYDHRPYMVTSWTLLNLLFRQEIT